MRRRKTTMGNPVQRIFDRRDSGEWVEGSGIIQRMLHDDDEGSRHQRFILDMHNGQSLLIAHNIDLAKRVPVGMGDRIKFRGMYEWNDMGGLIHWTHDDPMGSEQGGYIDFRKTLFK